MLAYGDRTIGSESGKIQSIGRKLERDDFTTWRILERAEASGGLTDADGC